MAEATFKIQGAKEIAQMFGDLPKQIKRSIINATKKCNYEVRNFSLGIFSAEIGAKFLYNTNK